MGMMMNEDVVFNRFINNEIFEKQKKTVASILKYFSRKYSL